MSKSPKRPLRLPTDSAHTLAVIAWAESEGLAVTRPGLYHVKIGPWNYYPTKQTFNSDLVPAQLRRGYAAFQTAVLEWRSNCGTETTSLGG